MLIEDEFDSMKTLSILLAKHSFSLLSGFVLNTNRPEGRGTNPTLTFDFHYEEKEQKFYHRKKTKHTSENDCSDNQSKKLFCRNER